ncbi:MAG TPA: nucleotide exchange factor GrpE [Methylomirabilota bacterium]|nr:nucleotide exchange factor GrpE [Methylomirabilota bacterium]
MSDNDLNPSQGASQASAPTPDAAQEGGAAPTEQSQVTLTQAELDELRAKAAKGEENYERLLRVSADFDNFKKRAARERLDAIKYANESLLERLVPVLDTFDMAIQAVNAPQGASMEALKTGVTMIYTQLKSTLTDAGLEELNVAGQKFDPNLHEAVSQQESAEAEEGSVLQQLRKGYRLQGRLIRPATVIVAKKPNA